MTVSPKTKKWFREHCDGSLTGKTILITGADSGIGFKTAEVAVWAGAAVILACRDNKKASAAKDTLIREYPQASVTVMHLDLADLSSLDAFAAELEARSTDIDAFVNNAGVFRRPGKTTADGFDLVMGTNYIGTYYLTEKVLPYLASLPHPVDCIETISIAHKMANVDYGDFYYARRYRNILIYARSKLCLARYACALAERYKDTNVRVVMSHPGIAVTPLGRDAFGKAVRRLAGFMKFLFNSPEKSSLAALCIIDDKDIPAGSIIGPTKCLGGWGYPKANRVSRKVKAGGEELLRFTENEINNKRGQDKRPPARM